MNSLPNPKEFKNFKADLSKRIKFENIESNYNLESIYQSMKKNHIPKGYVSNLLNNEILKSFYNTQNILKDCILFDSINKSVAIVLKEDNEVKTIAIQKSINKEGKPIKWKTLGSKTFIPYSIRDNAKVVFFLVGMKEYLLMRLMNLDYMIPQSDSIVMGLHNNQQWLEEIKPKLEDKLLVFITENDKSSQNLITPISKEYSNTFFIDINNLYLFHIISNGGIDKKLPKGFDFVDFCNMFNDIKSIQLSIKEFIEMELENE